MRQKLPCDPKAPMLENSCEMEVSSPPEADISVVEVQGGPEPYQFESLAPAPLSLKLSEPRMR